MNVLMHIAYICVYVCWGGVKRYGVLVPLYQWRVRWIL